MRALFLLPRGVLALLATRVATAAETAAGAAATAGAAVNTGPAGTVAAGTGPSLAGSMLQTVIALAIVLGVLGGLAWVFRKMARPAPGNSPLLRVVASQSLGARERVVIIETNAGSEHQWLVLGVTAQSVNLLQAMPRPEGAPTAGTPAAGPVGNVDFSRLLAQVLKRDKG